MKTIRVPLTVAGIEQAIQEVERYKAWLKEKIKELLTRLAERGVELASVNFASAQYDGTRVVQCLFEDRGANTVAVVAVGKSVLFIEFGSGIIYPDAHPDPVAAEYPHGSWSEGPEGKGHWDDPNGWYYAHGQKSYGNPANMSLYRARTELEREFEQIVRSVFV